jgi:hypothetical protein
VFIDFSMSRCVLAIFFFEIGKIDRRLFLQRRELDVDGGQGLPDLVVELAADPLALELLGGQDLVGEVPQVLLDVARLLQELPVMPLALLEGRSCAASRRPISRLSSRRSGGHARRSAAERRDGLSGSA